jgi:hypothetical protein
MTLFICGLFLVLVAGGEEKTKKENEKYIKRFSYPALRVFVNACVNQHSLNTMLFNFNFMTTLSNLPNNQK